jgi:hypothetical protein
MTKQRKSFLNIDSYSAATPVQILTGNNISTAVKYLKALVLCATENIEGLAVLSLEVDEWPGPPDMPTCGHTDMEQARVQFP